MLAIAREMIMIAAAVLLPVLTMAGPHALAENEPKVITLSCDGTVNQTGRSKPEPTEKMGVVVNLGEQTVSFEGWVARIEYVDAALIEFGGKQLGQQVKGMEATISGEIDRVTGRMTASTTISDPDLTHSSSDINATFNMHCKATNRVF
jgi:hypothetical protein